MKRRRRNKRREKMIMLYSSAFVLTVLTLTGVYVKEKNTRQQDYIIDLSQLEEEKIVEKPQEVSEPQEEIALVDSQKVENEKVLKKEESFPWEQAENSQRDTEIILVENQQEESQEEVLEFKEEDTLLWPVVGNVLIDYNMEKPVYFASLEQYRYHPAIVIKAQVGQNITAAAHGRITKIEKQDQLGNVITMELGSGYEVDYGQLTNIQVKVGDVVKQGDYLADVAEPTKFYSVEGCNVHFALRKDGKPINPMDRFQ